MRTTKKGIPTPRDNPFYITRFFILHKEINKGGLCLFMYIIDLMHKIIPSRNVLKIMGWQGLKMCYTLRQGQKEKSQVYHHLRLGLILFLPPQLEKEI